MKMTPLVVTSFPRESQTQNEKIFFQFQVADLLNP